MITTTESNQAVTVTASNPRPSDCASQAVDLDVMVTIDGKDFAGEVTLAPQQYDGRPTMFGDAPEYCVTSGLLDAIKDRLDRREVLKEIESVAAQQVPGRWVAGRWEINADVLSAPEER